MDKKTQSLFCIILLMVFGQGHIGRAQVLRKDSLIQLLNKATSPMEEVQLLLPISKEYTESYPDSALIFVNRALSLIDSLGLEVSLQGEAYVLLSSAFSYKGEYDKSIQFAFKALELGQSGNNQIVVYDAYANLGIDFMYREEYDKSKIYFEKAKAVAEEINRPERIAHSLNNLGLVAYYLGDDEEELRLYEEALEIFKSIGGKEGIGNALLNIGTVYTALENYDRAEKLYLEAMEIFKGIGYTAAFGNVVQSLSENYLEQGKYKEALNRSHQALQIFIDIDNKIDIVYTYELLIKTYAAREDYEQAYHYMKKYHELSEEIFNEEKSNQIVNLELKYETAKKEQQIALLDQKNKLASAQLATAEKEKWYYLLISLLILVAAVAIFFFYRQSKKSQRLLAEKNKQLSQLNATKDRLFGVVAHDLKNPLSAFSSITQSLIDNHAHISEADLKYFLERLFKSSRELNGLLQNLLEWSMSQSGELSFDPQQVSVKKAVAEALQPLQLSADIKHLTVEVGVEDNTGVYADPRMIVTVLRNLLSNAIKFTPERGTVKVSVSSMQEKAAITVADTGIGMEARHVESLFHYGTDYRKIGESTEKGTGLGLVLCKELIGRQGGDISVCSTPGQGSSFTITLPKAKLPDSIPVAV